MTTNSITVGNPYRKGSKLRMVFQHMSDGRLCSLEEITNAVYSNIPYVGNRYSLLKRRVSSALRTIRRLPNVTVDFHGGMYQIIQYKEFEV